MQHRIFRFFVPLLALIPFLGFSQANRTLRGIVTDQNSRPIPEAAVQIENERTLVVRSYITGSHGDFFFSELNVDTDYDLEAEFDGIRSPKKILSQFDSRKNATIKLVIRLPH
jgi:hypothetical protein